MCAVFVLRGCQNALAALIYGIIFRCYQSRSCRNTKVSVEFEYCVKLDAEETVQVWVFSY